jgi:SAM-dependent methyltransferase
MLRRKTDPLQLHGSDEPVSARSAQIVVPVILELTQVQSVVDVGCGTGSWLVEFQALGITDFLGIDGGHIPMSSLRISPDHFVAQDLAAPLSVDRRFDLAISLEVAEHLPEWASRTFIQSLTALADVVVFSAAVPFQTGPGHVNEQWPAYWAQRFADCGYVSIDCLRPLLWERDEIEDYYAQNVIVYSTPEAGSRLNTDVTPGVPFSLIHPRRWVAAHEVPMPPGVSGLPEYVSFHSRQVVRSLTRALRTRLPMFQSHRATTSPSP